MKKSIHKAKETILVLIISFSLHILGFFSFQENQKIKKIISYTYIYVCVCI